MKETGHHDKEVIWKTSKTLEEKPCTLHPTSTCRGTNLPESAGLLPERRHRRDSPRSEAKEQQPPWTREPWAPSAC